MMNTLGRQRGLSIWELFFFAVLVGATAIVVIKLMPLYMEKFKVVKAMKSVAEEPDARNFDDHEIMKRLLRHFEIEDVDRFGREEDFKKILTIDKNKDNAGRTMHMKYEIRGEFWGDLDAVVKVDNVTPIAAYAPQ